jgi:hypothetical protein
VARLLREESALRAVKGFPHRNVSWALSSNGRGVTCRASLPQQGGLRCTRCLYRQAILPAHPAYPGWPRGRPGHCPTTFHDDGQVQADAAVGPARPAPASSVRLRLGQTTAGRGYRAGDHADPGRPRLGCSLDRRLTNSPGSDTAGAERPDSGRRMPRCPDAQLDTGHRTPNTHTGRRTPGRLDAHTGHWTPVAWTSHTRGHWTLTPDTGRRMLLRTGQADKARPAPDILGHHAERLPAGTLGR